MITINDTLYDLNLIDILQELRFQLSGQGVYLFERMKELPEDIMVSCPFHKDGHEKKPSCGIRKSDGWVHCFTCNINCSLEQMISRCFGKDDFGQYGMSWLKNNFLGDVADNRNFNIDLSRKTNTTTKNNNYISESELDSYRYIHPYMYKRKMNNRVIQIFDVGYDMKTDCLTFPVRNKKGDCLFIARRSVKTKYFNYPNSVEKPIYGLYELYRLKYFPKEIYIVESMIDCIYLWTFKKYAIALNGLGTKNQINQISNLPCRKVILATDNDSAGQRARENLKRNIKNKIITEVVIPEGAKDINDCTAEQILNLKEVW